MPILCQSCDNVMLSYIYSWGVADCVTEFNVELQIVTHRGPHDKYLEPHGTYLKTHGTYFGPHGAYLGPHGT